jgi:thiol-disulfide isomerase/thioredoxin
MKNKIPWYEIPVILTGLLFIFSGCVKLFPIYSFEFLLVRQSIFSWALAPYAARVIISVELIFGVLLCLRFKLKTISIPLSALILSVFSVYLAISLATSGGTANCGCFGEVLPMSMLAALIKNIIMIAVLFFSFWKITSSVEKEYFKIPAIMAIVILTAVFLIFPVKAYKVPTISSSAAKLTDTASEQNVTAQTAPSSKVQAAAGEKKKDSVNSAAKEYAQFLQKYKRKTSVYSGFTEFNNKRVNTDEGEKVIVLFSLDCDHCLAAAKEFSKVYKKKQFPKILGLFFGEEQEVAGFFQSSGLTISYKILEPTIFFPLLIKSPPRITYLINGNVAGDWEGDNFSVAKLTDAIDKAHKTH